MTGEDAINESVLDEDPATKEQKKLRTALQKTEK
jgi:hypothetical protein